MPINGLLVVGAGGHAKVVIDAWSRSAGPSDGLVIADDDPKKIGTSFMSYRIAMTLDEAVLHGPAFHLAIGSTSVRARLHERLTRNGGRAVSILHPAASVAASATTGEGSFIAALAILAPDVRIRSSVIVNHGAVVDHDCIVGSFSHIGPNATLGGGVIVGAGVLVGSGATILPGVRVGDGAVIAAGSTIIRDVDPGETVIFTQVRKTRKI